MSIAVYANVRTSIKCLESWTAGFNTAFRAGSVMGFALVSLGLFVLYGLILLFHLQFSFNDPEHPHTASQILFECIAGYGLGGSCVALFCRVGGGIYTKAADVGADLVGKTELNIPEDDPRNPAVIADNVGDNVGDIAGMGADLFGSFAEATCACLLLSSGTVIFHVFSLSFFLSLSYIYMYIYIYINTLSLSHTYTYTHSLSLSHIHTLSHTHTLSLSQFQKI